MDEKFRFIFFRTFFFMSSTSLLDFHCEEFQSGFEEIDKNGESNSSPFICPICQSLARDPIEYGCCGHWYCSYCFIVYFKHPNSHASPADLARPFIKCAYCRKTINVHYYTTAAPLLQRKLLYTKLQVKCSFNCGRISDPLDISIHERKFCPKRPLRCPFPQCSATINASSITDHIADCPYQAIFCSKCRIAVYVDHFPWHNCVETLHGSIFAYEARHGFHMEPCHQGPPGHWVFHPRNVGKQPLQFYENIRACT